MSKKGIDWLEFNYFDDDNILNKRSTFFDVKHTLNSVIDIICKEHLQEDKWKRIDLSKNFNAVQRLNGNGVMYSRIISAVRCLKI